MLNIGKCSSEPFSFYLRIQEQGKAKAKKKESSTISHLSLMASLSSHHFYHNKFTSKVYTRSKSSFSPSIVSCKEQQDENTKPVGRRYFPPFVLCVKNMNLHHQNLSFWWVYIVLNLPHWYMQGNNIKKQWNCTSWSPLQFQACILLAVFSSLNVFGSDFSCLLATLFPIPIVKLLIEILGFLLLLSVICIDEEFWFPFSFHFLFALSSLFCLWVFVTRFQIASLVVRSASTLPRGLLVGFHGVYWCCCKDFWFVWHWFPTCP